MFDAVLVISIVALVLVAVHVGFVFLSQVNIFSNHSYYIFILLCYHCQLFFCYYNLFFIIVIICCCTLCCYYHFLYLLVASIYYYYFFCIYFHYFFFLFILLLFYIHHNICCFISLKTHLTFIHNFCPINIIALISVINFIILFIFSTFIIIIVIIFFKKTQQVKKLNKYIPYKLSVHFHEYSSTYKINLEISHNYIEIFLILFVNVLYIYK